MNRFTSLLLLTGLTLVSFAPAGRYVRPGSATYPPVAVLELFTSQGCSSCPAADRLLTETLNQAARSRQNIIGLSFHVDYWNRLGWKDPFSSAAFTKRQYQYGERFAKNGVYTPQQVLNGQQEFVGSNRARQQAALQTALGQPATVEVRLSAPAPAAGKLTVGYQLAGDLTDAVLHVALVSKRAETSVQRGENSGRKLAHNNVVRVFQTVPAVASGTLSLPLPAGFDARNGAVVGYVQARQTLAVRGAKQLSL